MLSRDQVLKEEIKAEVLHEIKEFVVKMLSPPVAKGKEKAIPAPAAPAAPVTSAAPADKKAKGTKKAPPAASEAPKETGKPA